MFYIALAIIAALAANVLLFSGEFSKILLSIPCVLVAGILFLLSQRAHRRELEQQRRKERC